MRSVRIFVTVVFSVVLCLGVVNAAGENSAGTFFLTPMIGGYVFDGSQDLENAPVYGAGIGYNYTDAIGVENTYGFIDTESDRTGERVEGFIIRFDGLYHFMTRERLVPYVAAGFGLISLNGDSREGNTNGLADYGAGIKYFLNESLALRGDVRHIFDFDGTDSNILYTAGLSFLIGKRPEKVSPPPADSDGDGVSDNDDRCPGTPKGVRVDSSGCPRDSDGDGVSDDRDRCPNTPPGAPVDRSGCMLDSDGDGVYDYRDRCPGTPRAVKVDERGCPLPIKERVSIELKVEFDHNSADVRSIYDEHIRKVVDFLSAYPGTTAVIEGHTDNRGSDQYNLRLSQKRAESVMRTLIGRGIDASRLKAIGYGESRPVADNGTDEGRRRNRRVVAVITTVTSR